MIQLDLGPEPAVLVKARKRYRATAVHAFNLHGPGTRKVGKDEKSLGDTLNGYNAGRGEGRVKILLWTRQFRKCAWCEKNPDWERLDVEHIRPKGRADDQDADGAWSHQSHEHYWWLAWTWENIVFSCVRCNGASNKGTKFPMRVCGERVAPPQRPLTEPIDWSQFDPSNEDPMLLNPRVEDPLDHLVWEPLDTSAPLDKWKWDVRGSTDRGVKTVEVLGLTGRLDDVQEHLKTNVLRRWIDIRSHINGRRWEEARASWSRLLSDYIDNDRAPFRAAAWWAVQVLLPLAYRVRLGFREPERPRVRYVPAPAIHPSP